MDRGIEAIALVASVNNLLLHVVIQLIIRCVINYQIHNWAEFLILHDVVLRSERAVCDILRSSLIHTWAVFLILHDVVLRTKREVCDILRSSLVYD